jgi:hypothetical protein
VKVNSIQFLDHISKASLGGLINEVVFKSDLSFAVTDESKSVVSVCNKGLVEHKYGEIGIFNLDLFGKAVQYAKDTIFSNGADIDMDIIDNRFVFKKGDNEFKFLLSSPSAISSTVENASAVLAKLSERSSVVVKLTALAKDTCLKAISLITSETCVFVISGGKAKFSVGKSTEHNAVVDLGSVKGTGNFKVCLQPAFVSKVFEVLPAEVDVILELREEMPVIIDADSYTFLIAPMEVESTNDDK